jgi:hypothetical protein
MKKLHFIALAAVFVAGQVWAQDKEDVNKDLLAGWWMIPKTTTQFKIGGYVKFDFIHDFNPITSPDFFDVSKIPTDGSKGQNTNLIAKETRLFIDTRTPSKVGDIRTYVEGDFYGSGGAFRLRHAFVEIDGKWLAGQWWSNFMDENIIPGTLDFEKPAAYAFARNAMLRYKHSLSDHAYFAFAVEQPSANAQAPVQGGKFESPLPDITARYRITKDWGHIQLSAFAAKLVYRYNAGGTDDVFQYGGNFSGQLNLIQNKDKFIYQVVYGPGAGRFRGGLSAGLDENGNLEALSEGGITLGYEHRWNHAFTSLVVYNQGWVNNSANQPTTALQGADYFAANLLWHFTDRAFVGVEYLWGKREDNDGDNGIANRIQFSMKYTFN